MKKMIKNNGFLISMLVGILAGCILGLLFPVVRQGDDLVSPGATVLEPLGTVFINLMFCIVVPMVFLSITSAIANMASMRRAGKIMGVTVLTFCVTASIAALIMYVVCRIYPVVQGKYMVVEGEIGQTLGVTDMIINFFTKPDFADLWSRRAILPLIVFAVLFGFGIQMAGGPETMTAKLLEDATKCTMKVVKIITYYAPLGFFGFFASLVATYGPELIGDYGRTLVLYYVMCFAYMFVFFPIYARFGGGKGAVKVMFRHLFKPAAVSFGTCSSVATIPTNLEAAEDTGINRDVADIVLPMGATMHMDGSCFSCVLKIAFVLGVFGEQLSWSRLPFIVLVAVLSSVGMSGVPGGGYIGEYIICSIFFPTQMELAFPILVAIGNLVDPPATMINSAGDYVVSYIVSRFVEGKDWLQKQLNNG